MKYILVPLVFLCCTLIVCGSPKAPRPTIPALDIVGTWTAPSHYRGDAVAETLHIQPRPQSPVGYTEYQYRRTLTVVSDSLVWFHRRAIWLEVGHLATYWDPTQERWEQHTFRDVDASWWWDNHTHQQVPLQPSQRWEEPILRYETQMKLWGVIYTRRTASL